MISLVVILCQVRPDGLEICLLTPYNLLLRCSHCFRTLLETYGDIQASSLRVDERPVMYGFLQQSL